MSRQRTVWAAGRALAALSLLAVVFWLGRPASTQEADAEAKPLHLTTPHGQALSPQELKQVAAVVRAHVKNAGEKGRIDVIRARLALSSKEENKEVVKAIIYKHRTGKALGVVIDPASGKVVQQEELPGVPQSSPDERAEAKGLIEKDADLAKLLAHGVLEGGFVTGPPEEAKQKGLAAHRILQFHLLTKDRTRFQRVLYVDLTDGRILSSKARD